MRFGWIAIGFCLAFPACTPTPRPSQWGDALLVVTAPPVGGGDVVTDPKGTPAALTSVQVQTRLLYPGTLTRCLSQLQSGDTRVGVFSRWDGPSGTLGREEPAGAGVDIEVPIDIAPGAQLTCVLKYRRAGVVKTLESPAARVVRLDAEIALGAQHTCALVNNARNPERKAVCWGANDKGQLGMNSLGKQFPASWTAVRRKRGSEISLLTGAVSLELGASFGCALDEDGQAWCWGSNEQGQLGIGPQGAALTQSAVALPVLQGNIPYRALAVGDDFACGVDLGSGVHCWGMNHGQLPLPRKGVWDTPTELAFPGRIRRVTAGGASFCTSQSGPFEGEQIDCLGMGADGAQTATFFWPLAVAIDLRVRSGVVCGTLSDMTQRCEGRADGERLGQRPEATSESKVAGARYWMFPELGAKAAVLPRKGVSCFSELLPGEGLPSLRCFGEGRVAPTGSTPMVGIDKSHRIGFSGAAAPVTGIASDDTAACVQLSGLKVGCWGDNTAGRLSPDSPDGAKLLLPQPLDFTGTLN